VRGIIVRSSSLVVSPSDDTWTGWPVVRGDWEVFIPFTTGIGDGGGRTSSMFDRSIPGRIWKYKSVYIEVAKARELTVESKDSVFASRFSSVWMYLPQS